MHWYDGITDVTPINGNYVGSMSNDGSWGTTSPQTTVPMYSFNEDDTYLISHIGQTISGQDISLIATINSTDTNDWNDNGAPNTRQQGITFFSSSNLQVNPDSTNNSIVVFYNGASNVSITYQFIDTDTITTNTDNSINIDNAEPLTLLYSFIPNDIDFDQGIYTDFNNLGVFIPDNTNIVQSNESDPETNLIYSNQTDLSLQGASSLPFGGYLGIGFNDSFTLDFYSPVPLTDYYSSNGVRYDLFGRDLQVPINLTNYTTPIPIPEQPNQDTPQQPSQDTSQNPNGNQSANNYPQNYYHPSYYSRISPLISNDSFASNSMLLALGSNLKSSGMLIDTPFFNEQFGNSSNDKNKYPNLWDISDITGTLADFGNATIKYFGEASGIVNGITILFSIITSSKVYLDTYNKLKKGGFSNSQAVTNAVLNSILVLSAAGAGETIGAIATPFGGAALSGIMATAATVATEKSNKDLIKNKGKDLLTKNVMKHANDNYYKTMFGTQPNYSSKTKLTKAEKKTQKIYAKNTRSLTKKDINVIKQGNNNYNMVMGKQNSKSKAISKKEKKQVGKDIKKAFNWLGKQANAIPKAIGKAIGKATGSNNKKPSSKSKKGGKRR